MTVHFHKCHIHLQWGVGKRAKQLQLRILLHWHQVENADCKGTHILMLRPVFVHDKYIFIF